MSVSAKEKIGGKVFNVPNQLTAARFVLAIVVFVLIPIDAHLAALIVFTIAASTDWVDGWWARKYDQVTQLGRIFDPFVDKIIICGTFVLLAVEMKVHFYPTTEVPLPMYCRIYGWMAVVVVGREMLVTALRGFIEQKGGDFSAKWAGKIKMVFQCAAVVASLVVLHLGTTGKAIELWLQWATAACIWLAVVSTIYSGIGYIVAAAKFVRE